MALIATDEKRINTNEESKPKTPNSTPRVESGGPSDKSAYTGEAVTTPAATTPATSKPVSSTTTGSTTQASPSYVNTMKTLAEAESSVPSFSSDYDDQISELYNKIINRGSFSYDYSTDPMYGQYKEAYTQQGKQAMRDTMGQAAALTGGYGSSYGQAVGQQQYDAYLQRLNDVLPELYGMARDVYADEGNVLNTQLSLAAAMRDAEYKQFRDAVGDDQYNKAWELEQADALAQYGNFSKYAELYGDEDADQMRLTWASANPDAAWTAGLITEDEYYKLTGKRPRGGLTRGGGGGDPWGYGGAGWNPGFQLEIGGLSPAEWYARNT